MLLPALQPSRIISGRGGWQMGTEECLWGLDLGIACPESEAIKSLGLFWAVDAGCCCGLCLCAGAQWECKAAASSLFLLLLLPTAPNLPQVCPRPVGSSALLWVLPPGCFGREQLSLSVGFRRAFLSLIELVDF